MGRKSEHTSEGGWFVSSDTGPSTYHAPTATGGHVATTPSSGSMAVPYAIIFFSVVLCGGIIWGVATDTLDPNYKSHKPTTLAKTGIVDHSSGEGGAFFLKAADNDSGHEDENVVRTVLHINIENTSDKQRWVNICGPRVTEYEPMNDTDADLTRCYAFNVNARSHYVKDETEQYSGSHYQNGKHVPPKYIGGGTAVAEVDGFPIR